MHHDTAKRRPCRRGPRIVTALTGTAGGEVRMPFGRRAGVRQSPDILDHLLFLPGIWLSCGLSVSLRMIGPVFVVFPVGFCILYALLRRAMPPRVMSVYFAFCLLVGALSWYRVFPNSWQIYFMQEAIIRQLIPVLGVVAVAWASKAYFRRRLRDGGVFSGAALIITLSIAVAPLMMYGQGMGYEGDYSLYADLAMWGAFINNNLIGFFFIFGAIYLAEGWRRYAALAFVLLVCVMSHFVQFKVLTMIVLAGLFGLPARKVMITAVAGFVTIYGVGINYVVETIKADPNDGLRLAFLADVLRSVADTSGAGIGYGRESVRWVYRFPGMPAFTFLPDPNSMTPARMLEALSTGVHNSFAQALLRSGVLGCLLLVLTMAVAFPPRTLPRPVRNHAISAFAMMFIACFVNPALESPIQVVGIGFVYGYLIALRALARTGTVRVGWSDRFGVRPTR